MFASPWLGVADEPEEDLDVELDDVVEVGGVLDNVDPDGVALVESLRLVSDADPMRVLWLPYSDAVSRAGLAEEGLMRELASVVCCLCAHASAPNTSAAPERI